MLPQKYEKNYCFDNGRKEFSKLIYPYSRMLSNGSIELLYNETFFVSEKIFFESRWYRNDKEMRKMFAK